MKRLLNACSIALPLFLALQFGCLGADDQPFADASLDAAFADAQSPDAEEPADAETGDADAETPDAGSADARPDAGVADLGSLPPYGHVPPPDASVPEALSSARWKQHHAEDVLPYWMMPEALGSPAGNFPTYRDMLGRPLLPGERRPRMMGRQTYAYSMAFLLTGDPSALRHAKAGVDYILAHAKDGTRGGYHGLLGADGRVIGSEPKYAQDTAYVVLGLAAYYFVTREPAVEAELLAARDLLFDPGTYWDEANQRIRDAMDPAMEQEIDQGDDGGYELVAQLDPINAFLLLSQPVLRDGTRRTQFLSDLETLAQQLIDMFWENGIFWGIHNKKGEYGGRHVDFGHTLKSYWMLLQIDKRLPHRPFQAFLVQNAKAWVDKAFDTPNGRWAKRPTSATEVEYGSDWWAYAEADQIAATLDLLDWSQAARLSSTTLHWLTDYVDTNAAKEIIPSINRTGGRVFNWPDTDNAKCNQWKNGYHSTEHALVMYLHGTALENAPAELHFAVPAAEVPSFVAKPYIFEGRELDRTSTATIAVGTSTLTTVRVRFDQLY